MTSRERHALRALGLLLASVAGSVDALGWLTLDEVFTAHMSGNTVGLTVHLASGDWHEVAKRAAVILDFLVGLAVGATGATIAHRRGSRGGFTFALSVEAALLLALVVAAEPVTRGAPLGRAAGGTYFALLALPALAMGIQSATLRRIEPARARTTYVTGMLTRLVENLVAWAVCTWDRRRLQRACDERERIAKGRVTVLASLWAGYAAGGIAAALLESVLGTRAFALPLLVLAVAISVDRSLAHAGVAEAGPEEG